MSTYARIPLALSVLLLLFTGGCSGQGGSVDADFVYKIETGGVVSGYSLVDTSLVVEAGRERIRIEQRTSYRMSLLGADVDSEIELDYLLEPEGKMVLSHSGNTSSSTNSANWSFENRDGQARFSSSLKHDNMEMDLPGDVVVENTLFFDDVVADFHGTDLEEKTYRTLDLADFVIRDAHFTKRSEEAVDLGGASYDVIVLDRSVESIGSKSRLWIDTETCMVVKTLQQDGNVITLADPSVIDEIERVDMDQYILNKTDVAIADVNGITYMKVRAKIRPLGLKATPELLNVPGQKFTGTVQDNEIEGVFEIQHARYGGSGAPPFPVSETDPELTEYLAADGVYESDDSVLIDKAREITAGAADSWEAATRLAAWVDDEIAYAIPGGGTARNTYNIRAGECGAHSILLATFCRSVGIPARMVWGCMYAPNLGGSFGQHGWTEVHMGPAGWIPVDATVGETDYVDSGHIRMGHFSSLRLRLNAREFEILDYRVEDATEEATIAAESGYDSYLGHFQAAGSELIVEIKVMDGSLVLDIPDNAVLALNKPDDEGRWVCKMAKHLFLVFDRETQNGSDEVKSFALHEVYSLPHQAADVSIRDDVPPDLLPCLGTYRFVALNDNFEVDWKRGSLTLQAPRTERDFRLKPGDQEGYWKSENGPFMVSFVAEEDGRVASMRLDSVTEFRKK